MKMTAYIILDRLDKIGDNVELKKILRELTSLIKEKDTFRVKLVAVAEARLEKDWKGLVEPDQIFEVKLDQRELSNMEMARREQQLLWEDE